MEELQQRRAGLALAVLEGNASPADLEEIEREIARQQLEEERAILVEQARELRAKAESERQAREERDRMAKRLQRVARLRVKQAQEIEQATDALANGLFSYFRSGDEALELSTALGINGEYFTKAEPSVAFIFWKLGAIRPVRRLLDMRLAHHHYQQPLSEIEKSWARLPTRADNQKETE